MSFGVKKKVGLLKVSPILVIIGFSLMIIGLVFHFYGLDSIHSRNLRKNVVLVNGSKRFDGWLKPNKGFIKVYFFNITNPEATISGEAAILNEIGPYFYDYTVSKVDVHQIGHDNLQYRVRYESKFNGNRTKPLSEMDQITIMNYPLIGPIIVSASAGQNIINQFKTVMHEIFPNVSSPFVTGTVKELLFDGIKLDCSARHHLVFLICRQLTIKSSDMFWMDEHRVFRFAFLHAKNRTSSDVYTVYTGVDNIKNVGQIRTFRNQTSLNHWNSKYCNMINGSSDGSNLYPMGLTKNSQIFYFEGSLGRSVFAVYKKSVDLDGVELYHFEANEQLFSNDNPDNFCYCPREIAKNEDEPDILVCPANGLLNLALYYFAPVIISFPWYLYGSPELQKVLPNVTKHKLEEIVTYLEIEPKSGIPIRGARRFQFNLLLPKIINFPYLQNIQETILPAFWCEFANKIEDDDFDNIRSAVYRINIYKIIIYVCIAFGAIMTLIFSIAFIIINKKFARTDLETVVAFSMKRKEEKDVSTTDAYQRHFM